MTTSRDSKRQKLSRLRSKIKEAQKAEQMKFEEWAKNLPDPGPVLAGGPMHFNSSKPDLGPFRDPSLPKEGESAKVSYIGFFNVNQDMKLDIKKLCEKFYDKFEVNLFVNYSGPNEISFMVDDEYVNIMRCSDFIYGYLSSQC